MIRQHPRAWLRVLAVVCASAGACAPQPPEPAGASDGSVDAAKVVIRSPPGTARPPFKFSAEDERLLEDVERGAFLYSWHAASTGTGMIPDRSSKSVVSTAGVGFQLSALPVGVERGWVSYVQAEERALTILRSLRDSPRKAGLFYHYLDGATGAPTKDGYEHAVSTIDSALLLAGVLTAGSYFGGEVRRIGDSLFESADWDFFVAKPGAGGEGAAPHEVGFISLAWRPAKADAPTGDGALAPYFWLDSGDEHRLVYFLAACAPREERRTPADLYYRLRRQLGAADDDPIVWFPFSGALFTSFFANCWIDYASMGADDPGAHGAGQRASVDWWENSRRAVLMHRAYAIRNPRGLSALGADAWGLTASDCAKGYAVPGIFPRPLNMRGARPEFDFSTFKAKDDPGDGTLAPYGAGCAVMFEPALAVRALRHYQSLRGSDGSPLVWREPRADDTGWYGFKDAFNEGTGWVATDYVAIDQGPLLLAIENARSGLVWRLFHEHPWVRDGMGRLGLTRSR